MITDNDIRNAIQQVEKASLENDEIHFSKTRDIFQARLDNLTTETEKYLEIAVIGELGSNTFDHNFIYSNDYIRGVYLNYKPKTTVIADFGQGIKSSLKTLYSVDNDLDALKLAFKEHVSSRNKEDRGNGLKFVSESVQENGWELFFQSGIGCCSIDKNGMKFYNSDISIIGCLIIINFSEG